MAEGCEIMCSSILNNKKGSALLYVVLVIFIVITVSVIIVNMLTYEIKINKITEEKLRAKYLAEAGVEQAMLEVGEKDDVIVHDDSGNVLYPYSLSISGGVIRIEAYGYINDAKRTKILCEIKDDAVSKWEETQVR
jgi:hypothetical protein